MHQPQGGKPVKTPDLETGRHDSCLSLEGNSGNGFYMGLAMFKLDIESILMRDLDRIVMGKFICHELWRSI